MSWPLVKPVCGKSTLSRFETESSRPSIVVRVDVAITPPRPLQVTCRAAGPARWGGAAARLWSIRRIRLRPPARGRTKCAAPASALGSAETNGFSVVASGLELVEEVGAGLRAEAGSDLADVAQTAVFGDPEEEGAEAVAALAPPLGPGPTTTSCVRKDLTFVQSGLRRPGR